MGDVVGGFVLGGRRVKHGSGTLSHGGLRVLDGVQERGMRVGCFVSEPHVILRGVHVVALGMLVLVLMLKTRRGVGRVLCCSLELLPWAPGKVPGKVLENTPVVSGKVSSLASNTVPGL